MENIFDRVGETLRNGYLVTAKFVEESHGNMNIRQFDSLALGELSSGHRVYYTINGGKNWSGAQEPISFDQREREQQPYNRTNLTTYIPYGFESLDIIPTSGGSRFLSLKKAWIVGSLTAAADKDGTWGNKREFAVLIYSKSELASYIQTILPQMGVPPADISKIKEDIIEKIVL